jgi:carboxyl-terminal processing protease
VKKSYWKYFLLSLMIPSISGMAEKQQEATDVPVAKPDQKVDLIRDILFPQIYNLVTKHYVEKPDPEKLLQGAINGMLSALDPHSSYMGPKEFKEFQDQAQGSIVGIGVQIVPDRGAIRVIAPIEDTPAYKAGLKPGDVITKIDGEFVFGLTTDEAIRKLKGKRPGTSVKVTFMRDGKTIEKEIKREEIKIYAVKWGVFEDTGYVRISSFSHTTEEDFKKAITEIKEKTKDKLKGMVIDIRSNPGGLVDAVVGVCNNLLEEGVIVSVKGREEDQKIEHKVEPTHLTKDIPVVVLIDEGSASCSEILAGAIQDHKRGLVVGTRSYGKGTVQVVLPFGGKKEIPEDSEFALLRDERALRLTISRYYTPLGRSIQGEGISPDVVVDQAEIKKIEHEAFRESAFSNAIGAEEAKRKQKEFLKKEKNHKKKDKDSKEGKGEKEEEEEEVFTSVSQRIPLERFEKMEEKDFQFSQAISMISVLHLLEKNKK